MKKIAIFLVACGTVLLGHNAWAQPCNSSHDCPPEKFFCSGIANRDFMGSCSDLPDWILDAKKTDEEKASLVMSIDLALFSYRQRLKECEPCMKLNKSYTKAIEGVITDFLSDKKKQP